ncbi:MAG: hypothetical protein K5929_07365 [Lachnospiraceae bacterium]|nr:hypothetical protein [Lachnospiraceae bacterium]
MKRNTKFRLRISAFAGTMLLTVAAWGMSGDTSVNAAKNPDPNHTTSFIEWTRVDDLKDYKYTFTGFLSYSDKWVTLGNSYDSQGRYRSSSWSEQDGLWYMQDRSDDPYIDLTVRPGGTFITKDTMNAPKFHYKGTDGDNEDSCKYAIQMMPNDKYLWVNSHNLHFQDSGDDFTFISDGDMFNKDKDVSRSMPSSTYKIFYNRSGAKDTFIDTYADWTINSCGDSGWGKASYFKIFKATEKFYSVIDEPCTIEKIFKIENDFLLKDGCTLTIPEGHVLTVTKGSFFVNGTINCYGTLLVQDGATIIPFSPSKGGGQINLIGGTMIVMPGGRAMIGLGKECLNSTQNATCTFKAYTDPTGKQAPRQSLVVNHGLLSIGRVDMKDKTTIENHKGGRLFLGYNVRKYFKKFVNTKYDTNSSAATLGLDPHYGSFTPVSTSVIKAYEGSAITVGNRPGLKSSVDINYYYYDSKGNEAHYTKI